MKVTVICKDDDSQWEEQLEVNSIETAEHEVNNIINSFNKSLKKGETKRSLVEIKSFIIYSELSNQELVKHYLQEYWRFKRYLSKYQIDQLWSENSNQGMRAFEKNIKINKLWLLNYIDFLPTKLVRKELKDIACEIENRNWKKLPPKE